MGTGRCADLQEVRCLCSTMQKTSDIVRGGFKQLIWVENGVKTLVEVSHTNQIGMLGVLISLTSERFPVCCRSAARGNNS